MKQRLGILILVLSGSLLGFIGGSLSCEQELPLQDLPARRAALLPSQVGTEADPDWPFDYCWRLERKLSGPRFLEQRGGFR